jgi:hypothetical protein
LIRKGTIKGSHLIPTKERQKKLKRHFFKTINKKELFQFCTDQEELNKAKADENKVGFQTLFFTEKKVLKVISQPKRTYADFSTPVDVKECKSEIMENFTTKRWIQPIRKYKRKSFTKFHQLKLNLFKHQDSVYFVNFSFS